MCQTFTTWRLGQLFDSNQEEQVVTLYVYSLLNTNIFALSSLKCSHFWNYSTSSSSLTCLHLTKTPLLLLLYTRVSLSAFESSGSEYWRDGEQCESARGRGALNPCGRAWYYSSRYTNAPKVFSLVLVPGVSHGYASVVFVRKGRCVSNTCVRRLSAHSSAIRCLEWQQ